MKRVAIIMSTYNGEKYLEEQLDSLFQQKDVSLTVFVRDDLSIDSTPDILHKHRHNINIIDNHSQNLGVGNSFMETLYYAGTDFDYYAFCDQDDVWESDKISHAISFFNDTKTPQLYNSNQTLVDNNLKFISFRYQFPINCSPLQILTNNKITGCTMVWNKELQKILTNVAHRPSTELLRVRIHDVWVSMVASLVGVVFYDSASKIKYRQHDNNVVGVKIESKISNWKKKIVNTSRQRGRSKLAINIQEKFEYLYDDKYKYMILTYAHYRNSFKLKWKLISDKELSNLSNEPRYQFIIKVLLNLV